MSIKLFVCLFVFFLSLNFVFAGWHTASSILPGTFSSGNFIFDGDLNISSGNDICIAGGNCLSSAGGGGGYWSQSGSNIYYNTGSVGIGTSVLDSTSVLTMVGDGIDKDVHLYAYSSDSATAKGDYEMFRARGTVATPLIVQDADSVGSIRWRAYDGDQFHYVAQVETYIDGTPGNNDLPTRMDFMLTPDGDYRPDTIMSITGQGYVGIGTKEPTDALTILGDGTDYDIHMYSYSSSGLSGKSDLDFFRARNTASSPQSVIDDDILGTIRWKAYDGDQFSSVARISVEIDGTPGNNDLPTRMEFHVTPDGANLDNAAMIIYNSGNVGIGTLETTDPGRDLYIRDATSSSWVGIEGDTGNDAGIAFYEGSTYKSSMFYDAGDDKFRIANRVAEPIEFSVNRDGTEIVAMTINSTGYVGIGETNPSHKLTIGSSETPVGAAAVVGIYGSSATYLILRDTTNNVESFVGTSSVLGGASAGSLSNHNFYILTNNANRMTIGNTGNVAVGVEPISTHKFHILGQNTASTTTFGLVVRDSSSVNNFWIRDDGAGYLRAAAWSYGSDRRMKENIEYFDGGLDTVLSLKPAKFDYINGSQDSIGFIAQDVQEVIPEAVEITDNETGMLGLKSDFIVPYLVNSIKELKSQNDELRQRVEYLELNN